MTEQEKSLDVICLGRVAVDLYSNNIGARLEDASTFSKYLGGSSGNVAYGSALQGLKSSMLARVGDEHMGRFVREELQSAGVDTSHLKTDRDRLTALVFLGIKDKDTFPLIFYRENCADMAIDKSDIPEDYIASSRSLAITGTHLSNPKTRDAVLHALDIAGKYGLKRILDIDYRPVLWGLTGIGDGETRYVESEAVTRDLQSVLANFDLIVGTEEEFHIAGGYTDTVMALKEARRFTDATLVCKRGPYGCSVFEGDIPELLDEGITVRGNPVEVMNVLGAGDAFMSGLLRGYLNDESWETSCAYANACGAIVVSRHGCAPAMPTREELDFYLQRIQSGGSSAVDDQIDHLHRVTKKRRRWGDLHLLAFDHRMQLEKAAAAAGVPMERIRDLKKLILEAYWQVVVSEGDQEECGVFIDGKYGQDALNSATGNGMWIARPVELPGSRPLVIEAGDVGTELKSWPADHIVKCLVFCQPGDEAALRIQQEKTVCDLYNACCASGHELLLELISPRHHEGDDSVYLKLVQRFYNLGVMPDWWKLPQMQRESWLALEKIITERDPYCHGALVLGLGSSVEDLSRAFEGAAAASIVKGFAVGRTIFMEPSVEWLNGVIDDGTLIQRIKNNYEHLKEVWKSARGNVVKGRAYG
ncbi:MAG: bifunctional 5-dehydro-2-deoxygluconokinase/5-dehydro-2-deoxyphosphogluconate aldolase [Porticoccaceae bacterium]